MKSICHIYEYSGIFWCQIIHPKLGANPEPMPMLHTVIGMRPGEFESICELFPEFPRCHADFCLN